MGNRSRSALWRSFFLIFTFLGAVTLFQNCSKVSFTSISQTVTSQIDSNLRAGGGEVYDGKLTFIHLEPDFECEKQAAPKSVLRRDLEGRWTLTINQKDRCGSIENQQMVNDVAYSTGENFLRYHDALYYQDNSAPETPLSLANFVQQFRVKPGINPNSSDKIPGDGVCANTQGDCSLLAAVQESNTVVGETIIVVPAGTYNLTDRLAFSTAHLTAVFGDSPLTTIINGGGSQGVISTASGSFFSQNTNSTFILQNLSINNGNSNVAFTAAGLNIYGSAHVKNCNFENHTGFNPVIYAGVTSKSILIEDTRVRNNQTTAIGAFGPYSLIVNNSELINNTGYGVDINNGTFHVEVLNSTIANNGLGILYRKCYHDCLVENSTISGNRSYGFSVDSPASNTIENMRVRNSTIANNGLDSGSNILVRVVESIGQSLLFENSIVSLGSSPRPNCEIASTTTNYSIIGASSIADDSSCGSTGFSLVDPLLLPLANNGGFSLTHGLSPTSPAVDSGSNLICSARDQRGFLRPVQKTGSSALCDIGSIEEQ
jgi:hypothetical protein